MSRPIQQLTSLSQIDGFDKENLTIDILLSLLKTNPQITHLDLSDRPLLNIENLKQLPELKNIINLKLDWLLPDDNKEVMGGDLIDLISKFSNAKEIEMKVDDGIPINFTISQFPHSPQLKKLKIDCEGEAGDKNLVTILSKCPHLELLQIGGFSALTGDKLEELKPCDNLKVLRLEDCQSVTDTGFVNMLGKFPRLEEFSLWGDLALSGKDLGKLPHLPLLAQIDLKYVNNLTNEVVAGILSQYQSIQQANFIGSRPVNFEELGNTPSLESLQKLKALYCQGLTNKGFENIVLLCPNLELLDTRHCKGIKQEFKGVHKSQELAKLRDDFKDRSPETSIASAQASSASTSQKTNNSISQ